MLKFKQFSGNYIEVANSTPNIAPTVYESMGEEEYKSQVDKDIDRCNYVNLRGDVDELKKRLQDTTHLKDLAVPVYSYTQGDFQGGGVFHELFNQEYLFLARTQHAEHSNENLEQAMPRISFSYLDDKNELCGLCLQVIPDINQKVDHPDRDYRLSVSVITGVNRAPQERQVLFLQQKELALSAGSSAAESTHPLSVQQVDKTLRKAINSEAIYALLNGILTEDGVNFAKAKALSARLEVSKNIDDRDTKLAFLRKVYQFSENPALKVHIESMLETAKNDLNYFEKRNWERLQTDLESVQSLPPNFLESFLKAHEKIKEIQENTKTSIKELEQTHSKLPNTKKKNFFRRNIGRMALIGFSFLAIVGILLTATGVLAPLGLVITGAAGIGITSALGAGAIAGITVGITGTVKHEKKLAQEISNQILTLKNEKETIIEEQKKAIDKIEDEFHQQIIDQGSGEPNPECSYGQISSRLKSVEPPDQSQPQASKEQKAENELLEENEPENNEPEENNDQDNRVPHQP